MWMDDWVLNWPLVFWPHPYRFRFFEAQTSVIVMGASGSTKEIKTPSSLPILKRRGGGGTVLLGPGVLVLTLGLVDPNRFETLSWGQKINQLWIDALKKLGISSLSIKGLGDVAYQDRKIIGISLFRKGPIVIYQGSLLVDVDLNQIERHLNHPPSEPDYRQNRSHRDFLTNLKTIGYQGSMTELTSHCRNHFDIHLESVFQKNERFNKKKRKTFV
jgi:lipoate-protein ligase A